MHSDLSAVALGFCAKKGPTFALRKVLAMTLARLSVVTQDIPHALWSSERDLRTFQFAVQQYVILLTLVHDGCRAAEELRDGVAFHLLDGARKRRGTLLGVIAEADKDELPGAVLEGEVRMNTLLGTIENLDTGRDGAALDAEATSVPGPDPLWQEFLTSGDSAGEYSDVRGVDFLVATAARAFELDAQVPSGLEGPELFTSLAAVMMSQTSASFAALAEEWNFHEVAAAAKDTTTAVQLILRFDAAANRREPGDHGELGEPGQSA